MSAAQLRLWRGMVLIAILLYAVSLALLLWASTTSRVIAAGEVTWQGLVDGVTAFVLVIVGMLIYTKANALIGDAARRLSYVIATALPPVMLVAMWLAADRLRWNVLLPGLAWRTWILLQTLPAAIALWRRLPND